MNQENPTKPKPCGYIHQGQFCTHPATQKIPVGKDGYTLLCDYHAGVLAAVVAEAEQGDNHESR